jgi:hypothetical protein
MFLEPVEGQRLAGGVRDALDDLHRVRGWDIPRFQ